MDGLPRCICETIDCERTRLDSNYGLTNIAVPLSSLILSLHLLPHLDCPLLFFRILEILTIARMNVPVVREEVKHSFLTGPARAKQASSDVGEPRSREAYNLNEDTLSDTIVDRSLYKGTTGVNCIVGIDAKHFADSIV